MVLIPNCFLYLGLDYIDEDNVYPASELDNLLDWFSDEYNNNDNTLNFEDILSNGIIIYILDFF